MNLYIQYFLSIPTLSETYFYTIDKKKGVIRIIVSVLM